MVLGENSFDLGKGQIIKELKTKVVTLNLKCNVTPL